MHADLQSFLDQHVTELAPLERAVNQATWMANITGEKRYEEEGALLTARLRRLYSASQPFEVLRGLKASGGVGDPLQARQLALLVNAYAANQGDPDRLERMVHLEKGLESRFSNFRATYRGRPASDNEIREVLAREEGVPSRREAWEASKQIGSEVREDLLRLVALRNEAARENGYDNYYSMMLLLDELDPDELFTTLEKLERLTRDPFRRYKSGLDQRLARRFACAPEELRPWHYGDPFFQEAPNSEVDVDHFFAGADLEGVARSFFTMLGFEVDDILRRSDLYERPGKCQHAFCLDMDHEGDVRVLCNLRPNENWMGTLLHELGHAIYDKHVDRSLPYLLRGPAHIMSTEAVAMLMGRLSKRAVWLRRYLGVAEPEARAAEERLSRALRGQLLVQTRWCLVMSHFERSLYRDPANDLDSLWWDLVEQLQEMRRPEGRQAPDWAAKIHLSVAPVYYHNYMLGEMMASQIEAHLVDDVVGGGPGAWERYVESPAAGGFLRQRLFAHGRREDWSRTLERTTGRKLEPEFFAASLDSGA